VTNAWNPTQYTKFANERSLPFFDLLELVEPATFGRAVDLGCGTGALTAVAAQRFGAADMLGIDASPAMLEEAEARIGPRLRFEHGDIAPWTSSGDHDLVIANASLQWVADHPAVLARWTAALAPGGQLAVQVPSNAQMPSHTVAREVARSEPFLSAFEGEPPADPVEQNVLSPEHYAQLLYELGFQRQHVRLQVYPHVLASSRDVVEWVKGTTLTRFQRLLPADLFEQFLAVYEQRLLEVVGDCSPFFFGFRRVLLWGRLVA
jgi:trans-aconitate 2-methyltransferase